ncbi:response regulator [Flavobacterium sp. Sd200]|uniref:LytR/AlgR family response regulator transcription factor n=1 Tax=Flavobacterium sp. Sd200 TaxID=2692211 RepID=UPI00136BD295|nr:LytTR family DNA-binding domain-containing protein [Flavobacterium sp. Sd200]MXN92427.1 response regulator [Flavobacterium sp. Sd200]
MQTTYRCLIVDDEQPAHNVIRSHIQKHERLEYAASAHNGVEALKLMAEQEFDMLFLDINMPLLNGVELMEQLSLRPVTIVTTAYTDFALESYTHDAVDYLIKPISLMAFNKAVQKAIIFCDAKRSAPMDVNTHLKINKTDPEIALTDVLYIESLGNYVKIHLTSDTRAVVVYASLLAIHDQVNAAGFIRVHKSYIANTAHVQSFTVGEIVLKNGVTLPVGRKYQILLNQLPKN